MVEWVDVYGVGGRRLSGLSGVSGVLSPEREVLSHE